VAATSTKGLLSTDRDLVSIEEIAEELPASGSLEAGKAERFANLVESS